MFKRKSVIILAKTGEQNAKLERKNKKKTGELNTKTGEQNAKNGEQNAKIVEQNAKTREQNAKTGEQNAKLQVEITPNPDGYIRIVLILKQRLNNIFPGDRGGGGAAKMSHFGTD